MGAKDKKAANAENAIQIPWDTFPSYVNRVWVVKGPGPDNTDEFHFSVKKDADFYDRPESTTAE